MRYRVHRFKIRMTEDKRELEDFVNRLEGDVVSTVPNVNSNRPGWFSYIDFILIVERLN